MSYKNYTDFHSTSSFVCRKLAQRDRRLRLIAHLRGVCYLGSLEAFDSNTLRQRTGDSCRRMSMRMISCITRPVS